MPRIILRKRMIRMKSISQAQNRVLHLPRYRVLSGTTGTGVGSGIGISSDITASYMQRE
jgi:hypothetical protein